VILGAIALDYFVYDWQGTVFLARKFVTFTQYLKFWR